MPNISLSQSNFAQLVRGKVVEVPGVFGSEDIKIALADIGYAAMRREVEEAMIGSSRNFLERLQAVLVMIVPPLAQQQSLCSVVVGDAVQPELVSLSQELDSIINELAGEKPSGEEEG